MARKKLVEPKIEQVSSEVSSEVIPEVKQYKQVPIFDIFGSIINYKLEEI